MISKEDFPDHILRAYDIRGLFPHEISSDLFYRFGYAFGQLIQRHQGHTVCVGRDGRLSSEMLENALIDGLLAAGITLYCIGCGPSPLLYYAEKILQPAGALMVTGSHNPKDFNGLKMIFQGQPFFGDDIQAFGRSVVTQDINTHHVPGTVVHYDLHTQYCERLIQDFKDHYHQGRALKVAWDPSHGAAAALTRQLVTQLPGEHILINDIIDGTFPAHHPDPTIASNLHQLQQVVLQHQCDIGIAFDGDGDRIGIIDDQGQFIRGDQFLQLYAEEVLRNNPGATILADVKASQSVFNRITELGGHGHMVATGHSNIKHKIRETGALLAGEMSGHVFFADRYYGYDDALYAAIRILGIVSLASQSLSAWRQQLPKLHNTPEIKISCLSQHKTLIIDHIRQALAHDNIVYNATDGVRITGEHGWWLLRASNTEEYLIGRAESSSVTGLAALQQQLEHYWHQAQKSIKGL